MNLTKLREAYIKERQRILDSDMTKKGKREDLKCLKINCSYVVNVMKAPSNK